LYSDICIIGLGTIGGFLAKNLSELDSTKNLLLIDYDTVELENTKNSIYDEKDIGKLKTKAICDKLNNKCRVNILNKKFIEGETKIPKFDLIIDCRDFTYNRKDLIDMRLYISFRNLIMDCRKNVNYLKQHEGKYASRLTRIDLKNAALNVTTLFEKGLINLMVKKRKVFEIPIDCISERIKALVDKNDVDIVYDDNNDFDGKLINLNNNYSSLIDINKDNELLVSLGDKHSPYNTKIVPKNTFSTIQDIIFSFSSLTKNLPYQFNYYIISVGIHNNKYYVELLPETGSA